MKVILARHYGYCMGVKLAIKKAMETAEKKERIWTDGPLIHNRQAVVELEKAGIVPLKSDEDLERGDTVLLRAHGVPRRRFEELGQKGVNIVDATCPHVEKAQEIIRRHTADGYYGLIIGDKNHAEIRSILGHAQGECAVVENLEEARKVTRKDKPFVVICQTTYSIFEIDRILAALPLDESRDVVVKTVCLATQDRQEAALELAERADVVFVVGGYHSANTKRLAEICKGINPRTHHIETEEEITPDMVEGAEVAGVTAGASTPDFIIERVVRKLEGM